MFLLGWKLNTTRSPKLPIRRPRQTAPDRVRRVLDDPQPCGARPARTAASMSTGSPAKCTGISAFVRGVIAASALARSMFRVSEIDVDEHRPRAPTRQITLAVATKLIAGVITSSPGPTPHTRSAISSASVAEVIARTVRPPRYAESAASNSWTLGPLAIQPDRSDLGDPWMVSSSIVGRVNGRNGIESSGAKGRRYAILDPAIKFRGADEFD